MEKANKKFLTHDMGSFSLGRAANILKYSKSV